MNQTDVLNIIRQHGPMTVNEIASHFEQTSTDWSHHYLVYDRVKRLTRYGLVEEEHREWKGKSLLVYWRAT